MLELRDIKKAYEAGDIGVEALKGISIAFRKSEFVAVLGPSGCGKTTLLNVIGGLDEYSEGDLIISGRSTKEYSDSDWDKYRNHSVGFVFQTYNLIPHQTVLANVELALTLSGVSKSERRARAMEALRKVGIDDQAKKKPNQLSGGQMQRVAIARALVNNPDILLADEPTGALDSETSVQIMEILKIISAEKLVIMVTHNPELANSYASRIVNVKDGLIVSDTDEYIPEKSEAKKTEKAKKYKTSMSFSTALFLSLNNLMTKKVRTALTSFAGSIGIIGIALILSLSSGLKAYINKVQEDTLSTYPISVKSHAMDMAGFMTELAGTAESTEYDHGTDKVYSKPVFGQLLNTWISERANNDLNSFKQYIEENSEFIDEYVTDIKYSYGISLNVYSKNTDNGIIKVNPMEVFSFLTGNGTDMSESNLLANTNTSSLNVWGELLDNRELLESQYEPLGDSRWPEEYNEIVLFVNENNEINDYVLCGLGLADQGKIADMMSDIVSGKPIEEELKSYSYEDILGLTFSLVPSSAHYDYNEETGIWEDKSNDELFMKRLIENGTELRIVGIMRPKESAVATSATNMIGYTHALTEYCISLNNQSEIVRIQRSEEIDETATKKYGKTLKYCEVDIFTGIPFGFTPILADITIQNVYAYIDKLPEEQKKLIYKKLQELDLSDEELLEKFEEQYKTNTETTKATFDGNLRTLGAAELETPTIIAFYAKDFESKNLIAEFIDNYNQKVGNEGSTEKQIRYTDYVGVMMNSISEIIDIISYVLIAFIGISLAVSSIMIGIITYISVLERTKEIGILRSIGASKHDISRVFTAETLIVGFISGLFGILATLLLNIPVNMLIYVLTDITDVSRLPLTGGIILIAISMFLTFVAGLIPSRLAAKKDPVVALRTE